MKATSFSGDHDFNAGKVVTRVVLESAFSKEIMIILGKGIAMKEHKAPLPIVVHVLQGSIDFGVEGEIHALQAGDILTLPEHVPHDLTAKENSVVRLTLSKGDRAERVAAVGSKSEKGPS